MPSLICRGEHCSSVISVTTLYQRTANGRPYIPLSMKLEFIGHDERYAIEQRQMSLFPQYIHEETGEAISKLSRGKTWLTATTTITINGKRSSAARRIKAAEESVRLRRRILQQSYYLAALPHLSDPPAWGALAGVRPTKLSTKHLLEGGNPRSADKMLKDVYFVAPER